MSQSGWLNFKRFVDPCGAVDIAVGSFMWLQIPPPICGSLNERPRYTSATSRVTGRGVLGLVKFDVYVAPHCVWFVQV